MTTPQSAQKVVGDALIKCITTLRAFRRDSPRTFALCLLVLSGGGLFGFTTVYYYGTLSSQRDEEEDTTSKETTSKTTTTLVTPRATPETAWETLANLALFCACVATIGILMGVRRARKMMIFSQPHIEGQPATSRGDGLNTTTTNNGQQKSWNGSQWVEPPAASVLTSPYRNGSTTSSHGVAASARPPDANWAKAKGPNSVWSGDGDGTNGANGSSLDNNNDDNIDFATGFGYSEGVTSETARERAYRETLWARREAEELEAEENEEDQRHHHEYFTKHDEYEDRRSSNNKQQKTSSSSSSSSKKEKESAAAKRERRWSKFDQRWESLDASSSTSRLPLTYNDIPWPPKMAKLLERKISERQDASDSTVLKKKVYRELIMRWHPDKFMQKYGKRVRAGGDEDRIKERVDAIAKSLSASMTSL